MDLSVMTTLFMFSALVSLICRIGAMTRGKTKPEVFWQHAALAIGIGCALLFPREYPLAFVMGGVVCFLLIGAHRWKHGAPTGTHKPFNIEPLEWPKISAGKD